MRSIYPYLKNNLSKITIISIMMIMIVVVARNKRWNDRIIQYDVTHYYGYLPSAFIYKDLSLNFKGEDEKYLVNKIFYSTTEDGKKVFKVSMGVSICYLPFFLLAHGYATISGADAYGFSVPYKVALVWSAVFYLLFGLLYLRKILKIWFSELVVSIVLLTCIFATNLYNYVSFDGPMSHVYSFAILTAFLWHIIQWHKKPTYRSSIIIGLLLGWIFLIRPTNLLIVSFFIGWGITNIHTLKNRLATFLMHWKKMAVIGVFAFLFCIPQFLYWKIYSGDWLFYSYVGERFYFSHPRMLEGLFSWRKGWLLYTPVMLTSIIGIFFLRKKIPEISVIYPLFFCTLLYITWSWWCWWYGGGYGQRSLTDWYGLMAIPIACFLAKIHSRKFLFLGVCSFVFASLVLNILQQKQYANTSIHYDSMTRSAYFYHFFSISKYPGLTPLLKSPDYDKARKGEQEYFWE